MANTKVKIEGNRKIVKSFSIKAKVVDEFNRVCDSKGLVPSHVIESLMEKYLSDDSGR